MEFNAGLWHSLLKLNINLQCKYLLKYTTSYIFISDYSDLPEKSVKTVLVWERMNEVMPYSFMFLLGNYICFNNIIFYSFTCCYVKLALFINFKCYFDYLYNINIYRNNIKRIRCFVYFFYVCVYSDAYLLFMHTIYS